MSVKSQYQFELELEKKWRQRKWLIPFISITTSLFLITAIWVCLYYFEDGYWWTIFPAGLLAHSFLIVALHDASHKAITRTRADRWILNISAGLLLLPFFGEAFRKSHLIHHGNSNSQHDPLWHEDKQFLFENYRLFYVLCEFVPLIFTAYLTFRSDNKRKKSGKKIKGPKISLWYMLLGFLTSAAVIIFLMPSIWFVLGMILVLNFCSKLRHWCEHIGTDEQGSNNTFWYPLGMGIGNHDTHHYASFISWPVLSIGLMKRKKNSNPLFAFWGVLFRKDFVHYTEEGNLMGRDR